MATLTLDDASRIIEAGLQKAGEVGLKPLTIAVLDAGGHLVALQRQDRSGILRPDIAQGKAWGALGMGLGSRALAKRAETAPAFFAALSSVSQGRIVPVPGGVLIRDPDGDIAGAVGVSGDLPDNDEACAVYGIEQARWVADTGEAGSH
ncbi:heme-binding protein [Paraburkholderia sediminicola]|uniref:GlcG/HbpS family heme-binding protein n=1 Tax=Paraburkholderia sediminicola TaxID=458836 RepID=UPI0038B8CB1B